MPLSFEHIPPKAAFNDYLVAFETLQDLLKGRRPTKFRKGAGENTLCESCNNQTGNWYGPAFVKWTTQGLEWFNKLNDKSLLTVEYYIQPLNVLKQIVVMALAMTSERTLQFHQELRRFALNKTQKYLPPPYQVYVYFNSGGQRRYASEVVIAKIDSNALSYVEAEIAMPPFGYCITSTGTNEYKSLADLLGLYDMSWFSTFDYNVWTPVQLRLPARETHEPLPLDYRSKSEIPSL